MKFVNMTILFVTMMTFLTIMGVPNMPFTSMLSNVGINVGAGTVNTSDVTTSNFWTQVNTILGVLAIAGGLGAVVAGLFGKSININLLVVPLAAWCLSNFATTGWIIINSVTEGWAKAILGLVFLPLSVMYLMAAVEFFFGTE